MNVCLPVSNVASVLGLLGWGPPLPMGPPLPPGALYVLGCENTRRGKLEYYCCVLYIYFIFSKYKFLSDFYGIITFLEGLDDVSLSRLAYDGGGRSSGGDVSSC
jgi:hypothetical protein